MWHLFHPALVHFTVAFLVVGGCCEAWGMLGRRENLARWGGVLVLIGTLSLLPTLVSGYLAANTVAVSLPAQRVLDAHEANAFALAALLVVAVFWKGWFRGRLPPSQRPWYAVLLLIAVALTVYGALLGGEMVYVHAVGIRH